ncbi:MAG: hypothetical protein ACOCP1_03865 [Campylobacterales bacterium]
MKKLLFLLLPIIGLAYDDCCEMISTNYNFKNISHQKNSNNTTHFDFLTQGDGFVKFSAQKAQDYSHYTTHKEVGIAEESKESMIENPDNMPIVE